MNAPMKLILWLFAGVVTLRLVRFLTSPFLRWIGYYHYYSPMFFTMSTWTALEIHLGTSYDFLKQENLCPRLILRHAAEGFVNLCTAVENGQVDRDQVLKGTLYYFNDSTLHRFGFEFRSPSLIHWLLFLQNYLEACLLKIISKKKIDLIHLGKVRRVRVTAGKLLEHKTKFEIYLRQFEKNKNRSATGKVGAPLLPAMGSQSA